MKKRINFFVLDITITGGVERVASNFAAYFTSRDDYEFIIYSVFKKDSHPAYSLPENIPVRYMIHDSFYNGSTLIKRIYSNWLMLRAFSKLSFSADDIVISNMAGCSDFLCLNKRKNKGKLICFEHTYHGAFRRFSALVKNILFRKADCVVTLTKSEQDYYASKFGKVVCIPNALTYLPSQDVTIHRKKRVISAGRLSWEKGYENLLVIYSTLAKKYPDWEFVIFGSGPLKDVLQSMLSSMPSNVKLFESTPNLREELSSSYLFVSSSVTEAFPMVMLEAIACGLPVVSFDCPCGPREIINNNENGKLIKMGNNEEYVAAIEEYINNLSMWEESSKMSYAISVKFVPEAIYQRWIELINSLNC